MNTRLRILLAVSFVFTSFGCQPPVPKPEVEVFKPCTKKPGPNQCEVFRDLFKVEEQKTTSLTISIRPDNTRCCKTKEMDGEAFEVCKTVSSNSCAAGWSED